jgi:hypothetical protein
MDLTPCHEEADCLKTDLAGPRREPRPAVEGEKDALGSHWPMERWTLTREDLRVAAFCVAFDDQRRLLLGLYPASTDIASLVQEVKQAERLCDALEENWMFDDTTQRVCPHCGRTINWAATRCGYCWLIVSPLTRDEAAGAAIPYSNRGEALRLTKERDSAAIEALLNERDRLREEAVEAKTTPAAITG